MRGVKINTPSHQSSPPAGERKHELKTVRVKFQIFLASL